MNKNRIGSILAGALLLALGVGVAVAWFPGVATGEPLPIESLANLAVELSFTPREDPEGSYVCDAVIKDATSGKVVSAPSVVSLMDQEATITTRLVSGAILEIKLNLEAPGTTATYLARIVSEGRVLSSQSIKLSIRQ